MFFFQWYIPLLNKYVWVGTPQDFHFFFSFFSERERENTQTGERSRGREKENPEQTPHSAWRPTQGSIPQLQDHDLTQNRESDSQPVEPPRCPTTQHFERNAEERHPAQTEGIMEGFLDEVTPEVCLKEWVGFCYFQGGGQILDNGYRKRTTLGKQEEIIREHAWSRGARDLKNGTSTSMKSPRRVRRFRKKQSNKVLCIRLVLVIFDKEKRKVCWDRYQIVI